MTKKKKSIIITFIFLALTACSSSDEVARVTAPDGKNDAILIETNGGATTSFGYEVYIAPVGSSPWRGTEVAGLYGAVRNESASGVNLRWLSSEELNIEYQEARVEALLKPAVEVSGRKIRVSLRPGVADPTAPAGGMFYNLQEAHQVK